MAKLPAILIIEDHPVMRKGLENYFTGTKRWTVFSACDPDESKKIQIASRFGIKERTVENILCCIYSKTGIHSRLKLQLL